MKANVSGQKYSFKAVRLLFAGVVIVVLAALVFAPAVSAGSMGSARRFEGSPSRSVSAAAARGQAMGAYYAAKEAARYQRSLAAMAARWQAMGRHYQTQKPGALSPSSAAMAARLRENGRAYAAQQAAQLARSRKAWAARWEAAGAAFAAQNRSLALGGQR
jgi:heme/copper-type cytochrome/quinol oxidase subunit 1